MEMYIWTLETLSLCISVSVSLLFCFPDTIRWVNFLFHMLYHEVLCWPTGQTNNSEIMSPNELLPFILYSQILCQSSGSWARKELCQLDAKCPGHGESSKIITRDGPHRNLHWRWPASLLPEAVRSQNRTPAVQLTSHPFLLLPLDSQ